MALSAALLFPAMLLVSSCSTAPGVPEAVKTTETRAPVPVREPEPPAAAATPRPGVAESDSRRAEVPIAAPVPAWVAPVAQSAFHRAQAALARGDLGRAQSMFRRIARSPRKDSWESALAWNGLAVIHRIRGDFPAAERGYLLAIERLQRMAALRAELQEAMPRPHIELDQRSFERSDSMRLSQRVPAELAAAPPLDLGTIAKASDASRIGAAEGVVRNNLAVLYRRFGALERAHREYARARTLIDSNLGPESYEAIALRANLGLYYDQIGRFDEAERLYASVTSGEKPDAESAPAQVAAANLAGLLVSTARLDEALPRAEAALSRAVARHGAMHAESVLALLNVGWVGHRLGKPAATGLLARAWLLAQQLPDWDIRLAADMAYSRHLQAQGKLAAAIWLAQRAVASMQVQQQRGRRLAGDLRGVLRGNGEDVYRHLAALRFGQGRIAEGDRVIAMLKSYGEPPPGDRGSAALALPAASRDEQAIDGAVGELTASLPALTREIAALERKNTRTAEEERRLAALEERLATMQREFQSFIAERAAGSTPGAEVARRIEDERRLMEVIERGKGEALILYTITEEDSLSFVLVAARYRRHVVVSIRRHELANLVANFRAAVLATGSDGLPSVDPRPAAQALYRVLFAPVEAAVRESGATSLVWSLDGPLRAVPVNALHDGEKYLLERYTISYFTAASLIGLASGAPVPLKTGRGLGLGITRATAGEDAMPRVEEELDAIFRGVKKGGSGKAAKANGVIRGDVFLNEYFTAERVRREMRTPRRVVHIATHFSAARTPNQSSALLTGEGWWPLPRLSAQSNLFRNVDLVTLAACGTALTEADELRGRFVESLAAVVQRLGANGVVASLWELSDAASATMMKEFYRLHFQDGMPTAAALRESQLLLLRAQAAGGSAGAGPMPGPAIAHPRFWAPLVLVGNWR